MKKDSKTDSQEMAQDNSGSTISNNQIDVEAMRLRQDFNTMAGVKKVITTVPVRKPNRQEYIRVHPDKEWQLQTAVLELKEDREHYLVAPEMWSEIPGEITPKLLLTAINRQGVLFIWPIKLPGEDGRLDNWNQSALDLVEIAKENWIRVVANMSLGAYEASKAGGELSEPVWPKTTFQELLNIAFKGRVIDSVDHPVLKRLAGEV